MVEQGIAGLHVRMIDSPSRQGKTTGRSMSPGTKVLIEVEFGPNDRKYVPAADLEEVPKGEDCMTLCAGGRYGTRADLHRLLLLRKLRGSLTNVFYSMESSNTEFLPHQFKPVLKFVESVRGAMLIADEVGLGKTIESLYIWKELQARAQARRLLVVCPAMLREKWRRDLRQRFSIDGVVVDARELAQNLAEIVEGDASRSAVLICSIEAIRIREDDIDPHAMQARHRIGRILSEYAAIEDEALFDLVIVDEAHYIRNPATANNHIVRLLRDASRNIVLLSATPLQTTSENLFNLLRIVSPEVFTDYPAFQLLFDVNKPIVTAMRALGGHPPDVTRAIAALSKALDGSLYKDDATLLALRERLRTSPGLSADDVAELQQVLESRTLFNQYFVRTRKRDVQEKRVIRDPVTLEVPFNPMEAQVYREFTAFLRGLYPDAPPVAVFALISRQRQLASSIVAALETWNEKGTLREVIEELFGPGSYPENGDEANQEPATDARPELSGKVDLDYLRKNDTKLRVLVDHLRKLLRDDPGVKIVIFTFFRSVVAYLCERLREAGIKATNLLGGMGEEKDAILESFSDPAGPNVLLSTEVGSEGIDLQFARILVNWDMPWNPMRIEQRIGRLDRIGQASPKITIINFYRPETLEDRILKRLHDRIELFKESIGDLEDILGEKTQQLAVQAFDPSLTDEQRERMAEQSLQSIANTRTLQHQLEEKAINLVGFSDLILSKISESHEAGRWIAPRDVLSIVEDFFRLNFPGTQIRPHRSESKRRILLSPEARESLGSFIRASRPQVPTSLHQASTPIVCAFDPGDTAKREPGMEMVQPLHPLVQWIRERFETSGNLFPSAAILLQRDALDVPSASYAFICHEWSVTGLKRRTELKFVAMRVDGATPLSSKVSERLVTVAAEQGTELPDVAERVDLQLLSSALKNVQSRMEDDFRQYLERFASENEGLCQRQEYNAKLVAERKRDEIRRTLETARSRYRPDSPIMATIERLNAGRLKRVEADMSMQLEKVKRHRDIDMNLSVVACGIIEVTREE